MVDQDVTRDPSADARYVLENYWSRGSDIPLPVDPIVISRLMDAEVYGANLPDGVSGKLDMDGLTYRIYLSRDNGPLRQRFTCAHELGHMYDHQRYGGPAKFVDFRDGRSQSGNHSHEIYANQFAAELLMPAALVTKFALARMTTSEMAKRFGVSLAAMGIRRENLRLNTV